MSRKKLAVFFTALLAAILAACSSAWADSPRDTVVNYAWEVYNFTWTADKPILLHNTSTWIPAGQIRGIPYTLNGTQTSYEDYKALIDQYKGGTNNGLYDTATYSIGKDANGNTIWRTSMKYGYACAAFVTDCIRKGFPASAGLTRRNATQFHLKAGWSERVTEGSRNNESYSKLKKGDYLDNYDHVILVVANDTSAQKISYVDQTPYWDENNHVGTHKGERTYSELNNGGYTPMFVTYPGEDGSIPIDEEHFSDPLFREYCRLRFDTDDDGYFSESEIENATDMGWHAGPHPDNVNPNADPNFSCRPEILADNGAKWKGIRSIEGVKYFKKLKYLYVYNDSIMGTIDVSGMTELEDLRCYGNNLAGYKITKINAEGCTSLKHIEAQNNNISSLVLSNCSELEYLDVSGNKLTSLDVSGFAKLKTLIADNNLLTSFNASGCSKLETINLSVNSFTTLTITGLTSLKTLNVSMCDNLTELNCSNNALTLLNAMSCDALKTVRCNNNLLTSLRLDFCPELEKVYCKNNKLVTGSIIIAGSTDKLLLVDRDSGVSTGADAPTFTDIHLPTGYVGETYSGYVKASGTGIITYASDVLFASSGLKFTGDNQYENTTGKIGGVPLSAYTFTCTMTATNFEGRAERECTITLINNGKGPKILTESSSLSPLIQNRAYSAIPIQESGGKSPFTWEKSSGNLPEGMRLKLGSDYIIYLYGTPSTAGKYTFSLTVTDSTSITGDTRHLYDRKEFTITVNPDDSSSRVTISGDIQNGTRKKTYSTALNASGGVSPYSWTLSSGKLPDGLELGPTTGKITGTATKAGTFTFTVKVTDKNGKFATKSYTVKITQTAVTGSIPATATRKGTFTGTPKASGGASPYVWSVSKGSLPNGLKLNTSTGKITGSPSKAGTFSFTIKAKDKNGAAGTKAYTITVTQTKVTGSIPATATRKGTFTGTPKASGGASPYVWSVSKGSLPNGLKLNTSTGKITGSPSKAGTFSFTIKAKDKNGAAGTKAYTITVTQTTVSGKVVATLTRKASYSKVLKATGGVSPYTWSVSAGSLPDGMKLGKSSGKISGSPTKAGTFKFTVKAKDKNGAAGTKTYTITVTQTKVTGSIPATATRKGTFTGTPKASGGASPYVWSVSKGNLPDGLKLNTSTGKITGSPTKAGTFSFTIKAKDKNGAAGTKTYTVKVTAATSANDTLPDNPEGAPSSGTPDTQDLPAIPEMPGMVTGLPESTAGTFTLTATLSVASEDILEAFEGRDSDIVAVKAGEPVTFILNTWDVEPEGATVFVDDKPSESITVSPEGTFTLPAELVHDDFKVSVKAVHGAVEIETDPLYITTR